VTVPKTAAIYASGVKVDQRIKLVRITARADQPAQYQFSDFERRTPLLVVGLLLQDRGDRGRPLRGFAALIDLGLPASFWSRYVSRAHCRDQSDHGRPDRLVRDHVRRAVRRARFQRSNDDCASGNTFRLDFDRVAWLATTKWAHLTGLPRGDYVLAAAAPDLRLTSW
jgi:hypothetical protein